MRKIEIKIQEEFEMILNILLEDIIDGNVSDLAVRTRPCLGCMPSTSQCLAQTISLRAQQTMVEIGLLSRLPSFRRMRLVFVVGEGLHPQPSKILG